MKNLESRRGIEKKHGSIFDRKEIVAPSHFVSVFHETKDISLPGIDRHGLVAHAEKHIGGRSMVKRNEIINSFLPRVLRDKGLSRGVIYAYPFLEHGSEGRGADRRFIKKDEKVLRSFFNDMKKYNPDYLGKLGVTTAEEYVVKLTDPEWLRSQYPGEVLEMKVDPEKCYVADVDYINQVAQNEGIARERGYSTDEGDAKKYYEAYWKNVVSLLDFLTWYRRGELDNESDGIKDADAYRDSNLYLGNRFYPIKGAPNDLPDEFVTPEILIPEDVPQEHIRVVE